MEDSGVLITAVVMNFGSSVGCQFAVLGVRGDVGFRDNWRVLI